MKKYFNPFKKWGCINLIMVICVLFQSCSSLKTKNKQKANAKKISREYIIKNYTSAKIFKILEESKISYTLDVADSTQFTNLIKVYYSKTGSNPMWYVKESLDGSSSLMALEMVKEEETLFNKAESFFASKNYDSAIVYFKKTISSYPENFKAVTNLADVYYVTEKLDTAEFYFKKSIALNPLEYQAYFFLADTYVKLGRHDEAMDMITMAYMLNKPSGSIFNAVKRIIDMSGYKINEDRFLIPGGFEIINPNKVNLYIPSAKESAWFPFIICQACWAAEDELKELITPNDPLDMIQHENCLINLIIFVAQKLEKGETVSENEKRIHDAMLDGHKNSILFWEFAAIKRPEVIYLIPKEQRAKIVEYIKKYVFVKK